MTGRRPDLDRFYGLLSELAVRTGGPRRLAECDGRMGWPQRGVYFFFEPGELREDGTSLRVVRVGTHALRPSATTLWGRLAQHRGNVAGRRPGGGNHRGSIFRMHVGTALLARGDWPESVRASWGVGSNAPTPVRQAEHDLEQAVSAYLGAMSLLWLGVDDAPGPESDRGVIETGTLALLSNCNRMPVDPSSQGWLGRDASSEQVRASGLWNVNHVRDHAPGRALTVLAIWIARSGR